MPAIERTNGGNFVSASAYPAKRRPAPEIYNGTQKHPEPFMSWDGRRERAAKFDARVLRRKGDRHRDGDSSRRRQPSINQQVTNLRL